MDKRYYTRLRSVYLPATCRLIFIAESPPASGKYFYDPSGKVTEPLFSAMMKHVLQFSPRTKTEGLELFKQSGYVLLDATYTPVNNGLSEKARDETIVRDYTRLTQHLLSLDADRQVPILLIKKNVRILLESRLLKDQFKVLNNGRIVPFPGYCDRNRQRFADEVERMFRNIGLRRKP
jgi:hypothetical protein